MRAEEGQARADFEHALMKGFLSAVTGVLGRRTHELLSFDQVRASLHVREQFYHGMQTVPIAKIVGSLNRYQDFDQRFMPTQTHTRERWIRIDAARLRDEELPPVELYQVGDVYFVRDGNHRVSVARERGQEFIDAEVIECPTRVPLHVPVSAEQLLLKAEYATFLEDTALDRLRPEQRIEFSMLGRHKYLENHIAVHRYYLGLERHTDVSLPEAVASWYDSVYMPVVNVIREQRVLEHFPGLTEADLYLWIMDHRYYLSEAYGKDVGAKAAAADFEVRFGQHGWKKAVRKEVRSLKARLRALFNPTRTKKDAKDTENDHTT